MSMIITIFKRSCIGGLVAIAMGCGAAAPKKAEVGKVGDAGGRREISRQTREDFDAVVKKYEEAKKGGWTKDKCESLASEFQDVAEENNNLPEALYDVGVLYRRCGMMDQANAAFKRTLQVYPDHQLAMTQLAVMELEKGNEQAGEELLRKAVAAGQNRLEVVPAYVNAATILRMRGIKGDDESFMKAQLNLRRALAIEAKYMPALYQLAMLYFDMAVTKKKTSYLTLASLVCDQAIKLDPEYAPIYHVLGEIYLEKQELVEALRSFEMAFKKDPNLFASYMNYAAINLGFRGYEAAKSAFERAIALNPNSYEAHIGLGVALRGLEDFQGAAAEYNKASQIDAKRTDYIFNLGVLEMDYLNDGSISGYDKAEGVFKRFLESATDEHKKDPDGKGPELSWYAKAEKRISNCGKAKVQIKEAEREMAEMKKLAEEQAKREAEMAEMMKKAKELEEKEAAGQAAPETGEVTTPSETGAGSAGATDTDMMDTDTGGDKAEGENKTAKGKK